ncbi:hypothetical protein N665_0241s0031 [Sinapis alba]|nr:hypothetical protein N665_0241s0031 [Sinapis alba]
MILTDEQGEKITASLKSNLILSVQRKLPLGKWRVLTTFSVSQTSGQYRPTSHPYKITITEETAIANSDLIQDSIFLSLARYEDIIDGTLKTIFLIALNQFKPSKLKDRTGRKFNFVWLMQKQLEAYVEREQPLICLIRFAKISFYRGEVQITNAFDASIVYFDPTMEEALQFKEKLVEDELPLAVFEMKNAKKEIVLQEDDWNKLEIKMISELFVSNQVDNCKIICSIEVVDTDWAWFYFSHKGCKHRAIKIGKNVPTRFKLHLIVRDETETCKLILLNTVAKTIVGHEAVDLWDGSYDEIEDPDVLPEPIKALVGKSFCFGISISSENVRDGSDTFKVLHIWAGDHILNIESQSEPTSMIGTSSSTVSSEVVLLLEGNSQNDSEECKTPFAKRKEEDVDLPDITSTSKKLCTSIKLEKEKEE